MVAQMSGEELRRLLEFITRMEGNPETEAGDMTAVFTRRYETHKTLRGFCFTFYCDLCDGSVTTPEYQTDAFEEALSLAQSEARRQFNMCHQCGRWICDEHYNEDEMQCIACAPRRNGGPADSSFHRENLSVLRRRQRKRRLFLSAMRKRHLKSRGERESFLWQTIYFGGLGGALGGLVGGLANSGLVPKDTPEGKAFSRHRASCPDCKKQEADILAEIGRQAYGQNPDAWPQSDKLKLIQSNIASVQAKLNAAKAEQQSEGTGRKKEEKAACTCPSCGLEPGGCESLPGVRYEAGRLRESTAPPAGRS